MATIVKARLKVLDFFLRQSAKTISDFVIKIVDFEVEMIIQQEEHCSINSEFPIS